MTVRVAIISANLGSYDRQVVWPDQIVPASITVDVHRFTDENFPPRTKAMTSRLQAGIPKWWGWQMLPGYDWYLWIDASCTPTPHAVMWFLSQVNDKDTEILVFRHPDRRCVTEEYEFIRERMARPGETYLNSRYAGEWIEDQYRWACAITERELYATTAFAYRSTPHIQSAFQEMWGAKARWCLHDQLMFPTAIRKCVIAVMDDHYLKCPALTFTRKR